MIRTRPEISDPITFEVVRGALESIADDMALTVLRTAHSQVVRETMDFSTALCDDQGRLVAQGLCVPLHLGSIPHAIACVRNHFSAGESLAEGDVVILNDPENGGMHLPDVFMFRPIFSDGALVGYAACVAHWPEIGGRTAGGNAVDSTEIFQEGLQIPILKLRDHGVENTAIVELIARNVRIPETVLGDLRAQEAACFTGASRYLELLERYGRATTQRVIDELLDYTEFLVRQQLANAKSGTFTFEDYIDDDGLGNGPLPIRVALTIADGQLTADFAGTVGQVRTALNATVSFAKSAVYTGVLCALDGDVPTNAGMHRAVTVLVPDGTILNPRFPAARAARGQTGFRAVDTVLGALHLALPDRVPAAGEGGATMIAYGGQRESGEAFVFVDFVAAGYGGRPEGDGVDGTSPLAGNLANLPIEEVELEQPIVIEKYGFVPNTSGSGRWRGCVAVVRQYRLLCDGVLQIRSDRRQHPPYGLAGGLPGAPSVNILNPGRNRRVLPTNVTLAVRSGDVLRHVTAGGGGFGEPGERSRAAVARDVAQGKITRVAARREYPSGAQARV